jgi:hypothetical protein
MEVGWFSAGAKGRGNTIGAKHRNGDDMASFAFPGSAPASVRHFNETRENRREQDSSAPMFRPELARRACAIYRKILFGVARHCFDRIFEKTLVLHRDVAARVG